MLRKIILIYALALTSCISVAVETDTPTPELFVTSTLPPTSVNNLPFTRTPTIEAATVTPTIAITAPAHCTDSAVLLEDVTIPDGTQVNASEKFTKTWRFLNNGTCPWINYTLVFAAGDQMSAPLSAPIPLTEAKAKVDVSIELTAPTPDGSYTGYFTLHNTNNEVVPIGTEKTFWVRITVGTVTDAPTSGAVPTASGNSGGVTGNCNYSQNAGYVSQIESLINAERTNAGLPSLTVNAALASAAQAHAVDMACNNFLGHTGSDGSYINDRLSRAGYPINTGYSEIIAIGTPQDAINQWKSDQPHWDIVMNRGLTAFGVGYAYYASSDYGGYITVDFGSP